MTTPTSNSSEELEQLYRKAWLNGLDGQKDMEQWLLDAQAFINREKHSLLNTVEEQYLLLGDVEFSEWCISERSNLTKKGEE